MAGILDYIFGREQEAPGGILNQQPPPQQSYINQVQAPGSSMAGRVGDFIGSDAYNQAMIGLMSGNGNMDSLARGFAGYTHGKSAEKEKLAQGDEYVRQASAAAQQRKAMNDYLKGVSGISPEQQAYLASDPEAARAMALESMKPKKYDAPTVQDFYDEKTGTNYKAQWNQASGSWDRVGGSKAASNGMTIKTNPDGSTEVSYGGAAKPPTGYQWAADGTTLEPIPGGPATALSAEVAGRVGLARSFLDQVPEIKAEVSKGTVTGMYDRAMAGNNSSSPQAAVYRKIQSGADSLQRMLTGAGMPASEAATYAARYLPTYTDSAESLNNKIDQLARELESIEATVTQGKGGVQPMAPQAGQPIPPQGAPQTVQPPAQPGVETWTRDPSGNLIRAQ
ncbi:hypothetical protein [Kaistia terrae]|uniref:Uncharacterized protein n=1 Tax=Kaistia terrae TaxID=537017 RepID=A0ABW0Q293_9HYPH|nr:hypothetical protein [Kaistia terrae]MCX5581493.1 hypothetical protein [Kaistia terrae]